VEFPLDMLFLLGVAIGLVGIVVPAVPGTLLILAVVTGWSLVVREPQGWAVLGFVALLLALGTVVKYAVPGRHLRNAGIPTSSILLGAVLGIVGFFVVRVIGLPLGFVLGIYLAEHRRVGHTLARGTTVTALKAVGLSLLIELTTGLIAASALLVGAITT
jgi:uncharacterized protein YqgC (DUF456 family)